MAYTIPLILLLFWGSWQNFYILGLETFPKETKLTQIGESNSFKPHVPWILRNPLFKSWVKHHYPISVLGSEHRLMSIENEECLRFIVYEDSISISTKIRKQNYVDLDLKGRSVSC